MIKPKNSQFPSFCQLFTPHTLTYWLAQLPISHFQDSLSHVTCSSYYTYFQTFCPTWDYVPSFSQDMFSDLISLSLFLGFTASMLVSRFTANQICYNQCEAKMKRSQIGVRRISELLCVKSTSFSFFSFFLPSPVSNFRLKLGIYPGMAKMGPVQPILKPVWNTTVSVPVHALVRNILTIPVSTVQNRLPWL